MSGWRDPSEAEVEDALRRVPELSRDPALARERAVRYARAVAWQRDAGLVPRLGEDTRGHFAENVERRATAMRRVRVKAPDGVTYGSGKKGGS